MEHECDCHEHGGHGAENMPALQKKRRQLLLLKEHMVKVNALHDKIDTVMGKVEKGNIGLLLTQQKKDNCKCKLNSCFNQELKLRTRKTSRMP